MMAQDQPPDPINITPEMIEAGVNAYLDLGDSEELAATSASLIVEEIFRAMVKASPARVNPPPRPPGSYCGDGSVSTAGDDLHIVKLRT